MTHRIRTRTKVFATAVTLAGRLEWTGRDDRDPLSWAVWLGSVLAPWRGGCKPMAPWRRVPAGAPVRPMLHSHPELSLSELETAMEAAKAACRTQWTPVGDGGWMRLADAARETDCLRSEYARRNQWSMRRTLPLREQVRLLCIHTWVYCFTCETPADCPHSL